MKDAKTKTPKFSIPVPPGFKPPTNTQEGQENSKMFTVTDDWELDDSNPTKPRLVLKQIGDHVIKPEDHEDTNRGEEAVMSWKDEGQGMVDDLKDAGYGGQTE